MEARLVQQWFDAHAGAVLLYARQWLERAGAEDVVQEVFVRLMGQKSAPENVRAWLFAAGRNAAIDALRSSTSRVGRERRAAVARSEEWFEARTEDLIDAATAQEALAGLAMEQREVIVMRIWGEMTLAEIGAVMGEAVSTVFSRYQSGLKALRQKMESACGRKTR